MIFLSNYILLILESGTSTKLQKHIKTQIKLEFIVKFISHSMFKVLRYENSKQDQS